MPTLKKETTRQRDPKLPHERDESPGNAADAPRGEGRKAYEDAKRGMPDTDRAPVADKTYRKLRRKP